MRKVIFLVLMMLLGGCVPLHNGLDANMYVDKMTGTRVMRTADAAIMRRDGYFSYLRFSVSTKVDGTKLALLRIAYEAPDWVFFDECWIKIGEKIHKFERLRPSRDVLYGGLILESEHIIVGSAMLSEMAKAEPSVILIRLYGKDGYVEWKANQGVVNNAKAALTELQEAQPTPL